ncbi:YjdF family protein [Microbispora sp. ATCC PTA-5024]|uniref:YjdF family protein n=1 Tax=Microbispora sp. ATCC PTA-5024 TaxID=316330 RepID=UPI0018DBAE2B|nr:YjdF family protein [Microbispora sp. ATCC PTA-5024]
MISLSVYFEDPFWVGVLEISEDGLLRATRFVLGSEPTDAELHAFLMRHGVVLLERAEAAPPVAVDATRTARVNPKRAAKLAARAAASISRPRTASQEAMRLETEARKQEAATGRKEREQAAAEHRREVARRKRIARRRDR